MNTIKGVVTQLTEIKSGTSANGYDWATQQVIVDYSQDAPKLVAIDFDPDKFPDFAALQKNDEVEITYYPISTQSKTGSYFTSLKAKRLTVIREAARPAASQQSNPLPPAAASAEPAEATGRRAVNRTAEAPPAAAAEEEAYDLPF